MKMNRIALGIALLTTTASALAFDGDRRTTTNGAIVWSTRNRDGNKFSLVFQFGNGGTAIDLRYQQDPNRRDVRYDRGRYGGYDQGYYPPVYDYRDYRGHEYDQRYFSCYEEWSDWKEWQKHWSKRKNWQRNSRERNRAWDAFVSERSRAYTQWSRAHGQGNDRYNQNDRNNQDDRYNRNGKDDRKGGHGH